MPSRLRSVSVQMCAQAAIQGGPSDPNPGCFPGVKDLSHRQDLKNRSACWPASDLAGGQTRMLFRSPSWSPSAMTALQTRSLQLTAPMCCAEFSRLHQRPDCLPGPLCASSNCELRAEVGQALWLNCAASRALQTSTIVNIVLCSCMAPLDSFCCKSS